MKKTFLTFVITVFFVSVGVAQSNEITETQVDDSQLEKVEPSVFMYQDEPEPTKVGMDDLPSAVQDAFQNGQYKDFEVLAIYEIVDESGTEPTVYEFELAQIGEGTESTEIEGLETEKVSNRQPDVVLKIDENGQVLEEKNADEME